MPQKDSLEDVLSEHMKLESTIKQQNTKLLELEAHKRTLIQAIINNVPSSHYPFYHLNKLKELIEIEDKYKFHIYSIGDTVETNSNDNVIAPSNYMILRKYVKNKLCKFDSKKIFYLSTLYYKNQEWFFEIRDEENNVWKGENAFEIFKSSFDRFDFKDMHDWFGLYNSKVQEIFKSLK